MEKRKKFQKIKKWQEVVWPKWRKKDTKMTQNRDFNGNMGIEIEMPLCWSWIGL